MQPSTEFQRMPSQSIYWTGCLIVFSSATINPAAYKSPLVWWDAVCACSRESSIFRPSSKYPTGWKPLLLQRFSNGRSSLIKIYGAVDSPNGSTLNMKYLILSYEYKDLFIDMAVRNNRSELAIANRHQERWNFTRWKIIVHGLWLDERCFFTSENLSFSALIGWPERATPARRLV